MTPACFVDCKVPKVIKGEKKFGTLNLTAFDRPMTDNREEKICLHGFTMIARIPNFFFCQLKPKKCSKVYYHSLWQSDSTKKCISFKLKSNIYVIAMFEHLNYDYSIHPNMLINQ